jgi:hypothetical protein
VTLVFIGSDPGIMLGNLRPDLLKGAAGELFPVYLSDRTWLFGKIRVEILLVWTDGLGEEVAVENG